MLHWRVPLCIVDLMPASQSYMKLVKDGVAVAKWTPTIGMRKCNSKCHSHVHLSVYGVKFSLLVVSHLVSIEQPKDI
jgi:hypothetical protein